MINDLTVRRRARFLARVGAIGSGVMLAVTAFGASPSGIPPARAAESGLSATIVTPDDGSPGAGSPIAAGDKTTVFSLQPPAGGGCTGDTATDFFFVQSYIVPASVDPATLTFDAAGPLPQGTGADLRQPMYTTTGSPHVNAPTLENPGSPRPRPGEIINVPAFDFSLYQAGFIPTGTYNLGLACTKGPAGANQLDRWFNVQIAVTTDPADPAAFTWTVVEGGSTGGSTTTTTADGSTTTTAGGSTTTTTADGSTTSTTADGSTTTTGGGSDVFASGSGPSGTAIVASLTTLPATGTSVLSPLMWAGLLLVFGRLAVLLGRPPRVLPPRAG